MAQVVPEDALESAQAQESDGHGHTRSRKNRNAGIEKVPAKVGWNHRFETYRKFFRLFLIGVAWLVMMFFMLVGTKHAMSIFVYEIDPQVVQAIHIKTRPKEIAFGWPMAPFDSLASTDRCNILITNPCKPQYQGPHREGCQKETMTGFGMQTSLDGGTVTVTMQPVLQWPFLPETWNNEAWCNVLLVVEDSRDITIDTHSAVVIAEHVRLKSLKLKNNGGRVWFQAKNLTVAQELLVQASSGGVLLEGLEMPTEAQASIRMNAGSVDITTESSPNIEVESISDAVCLVGKFSSYTPPSQINTTQQLGNNTVIHHRAVLECSSAQTCRQPKWQVFAGSESSSIGIQALNAAGATVHSGAAFQKFDTDILPLYHHGLSSAPMNACTLDQDGFFAKLFPTPSRLGFEIISVKGIGIMRAGLQVIVSEKKVWLSLGNWFSYFLALYGLLSWFTVMPTVEHRQATIAFCPAHGYPTVRAKKNLLAPMNSIVAQAISGVENTNADVAMAFRNLGGDSFDVANYTLSKKHSVRDGFTHKDYTTGVGVTRCCLWRDKLVPDCSYCADQSYYSCTQISGAFKGFSGKCEGFPNFQGCSLESVTIRANMFTLYPKSDGGSCFQGDEVAALMTDRETFFEHANVSRTGDITMSDSSTCMTTAGISSIVDGDLLSNYFENGSINAALVLSFLIGIIVGGFAIRMVFKIFYKPGRVNYIVQIILLNSEALAIFMRVVSESERFVIVDDSHVEEEEEGLVGKRVLCHLSLNQLPPPKTILETITSWICMKPKRQRPLKATKIEDVASARWVQRATYLAYLRPDVHGHVNDVWDWDNQEEAQNARIVYLDGESQIEWNDDVRDKFSKLQKDTFKISYLVQRLQIETSVLFFAGCPAISKDSTMISRTGEANLGVDTSSDVPRFWSQIGKEVYSWAYPTTFFGELCYIALHFAFNAVPLLIIYLLMINLLYVEVLEKGLAVYGLGSDAAFFQEYTVPAAGSYIAIFSSSVLFLYYCRTKFWWDPEEAGFSQVERDLARPSEDGACVESNPQDGSSTRDARFWYNVHDNVAKVAIWIVYNLEYMTLIFCVIVSCVWVILGMFLEPTKVAPYATAVTGLIAHTVSMALRMKGFLDDCKMQLKHEIEDFEEKLLREVIDNVKQMEAAMAISADMQAVGEAAKFRHAVDVDALNVDIHSAANEEEAKGLLIRRLKSMLEPPLKRMGIPWSKAIPAIEKISLDELKESIESGSIEPILLKMSTDDSLKMPENSRELLMAKVQPSAKARLAQMGVSWRQAAPAFEHVPADVLKECLLTGKVEPVMSRLTSFAMHTSDIQSRYDEARTKMQEAVALGRKEVKMYEVENMLRKYGLSPQDIVLAVAVSVTLLCLTFLFLFIGMSAFTGMDAEAGQAAVNSFITGGAAFIMNLASSGESSQKLRKIIDLTIEEYKKTRMNNTLSFSMDEDIFTVMNRALHVKIDPEDRAA